MLQSDLQIELKTPFGTIKTIFDGNPIHFHCINIPPDARCFPDVDKAYRIFVDIEPDGKEHKLEFLLTGCEAKAESDTGERMEAVSFYSGEGKITLSCYASFVQYPDWGFDFDGDLREDGIELYISPKTKTKRFLFASSWMEHCTKENETQTWLGADPWPKDI